MSIYKIDLLSGRKCVENTFALEKVLSHFFTTHKMMGGREDKERGELLLHRKTILMQLFLKKMEVELSWTHLSKAREGLEQVFPPDLPTLDATPSAASASHCCLKRSLDLSMFYYLVINLTTKPGWICKFLIPIDISTVQYVDEDLLYRLDEKHRNEWIRWSWHRGMSWLEPQRT